MTPHGSPHWRRFWLDHDRRQCGRAGTGLIGLAAVIVLIALGSIHP